MPRDGSQGHRARPATLWRSLGILTYRQGAIVVELALGVLRVSAEGCRTVACFILALAIATCLARAVAVLEATHLAERAVARIVALQIVSATHERVAEVLGHPLAATKIYDAAVLVTGLRAAGDIVKYLGVGRGHRLRIAAGVRHAVSINRDDGAVLGSGSVRRQPRFGAAARLGRRVKTASAGEKQDSERRNTDAFPQARHATLSIADEARCRATKRQVADLASL